METLLVTDFDTMTIFEIDLQSDSIFHSTSKMIFTDFILNLQL